MTTVVTHSGRPHADDVCAVATLRILLGRDAEVVRSRDRGVIERADYVVDVGALYDPEKNRFDHHQPEGAGERENGIPYAAFGLVWKEYGERVCGSREVSLLIDQSLVQSIDAGDNGIKIDTPLFEGIDTYDIHDILTAFRPTWKEEKEYDELFMKFVEWAETLIRREIKVFQDRIEGWEIVEKIYQETDDKRLIIFDRPLPWFDYLIGKPEPLLVVDPSSSGGWHVEAVPKDSMSFERRIYLPREWAGKRDEELQQATGIPHARFVHKDRFMGVADTKEGAIALAKKVLRE